MIGVFPLLYFGWKITKKTKIMKPEEVDLFRDLDGIEEYERNYVPTPPKYDIISCLPLISLQIADGRNRNYYEKIVDLLFS
jgi:hypothetical protein